MRDIMLDLETMGVAPGCQILSIGAVAFGPDGLGDEFYIVVERGTQEELGLTVNDDTYQWWMRQSPEARQVFDAPKVLFSEGLLAYSVFCNSVASIGKLRVWGCGSDFDQPILTACYAAAKCEPQWKFWNNRCYRTLKSLYGTAISRTGTYHNALDDAKSQAEHVVRIMDEYALPWA